MTAALIVIEVAAREVSEDALSVLVASCNRAAREAECVLARDANEQEPGAVAIVSLQPDEKARVEVGVRQSGHDSWRTKDFSFLAADPELDRFRAIGFAIGTLAESSGSQTSKEAAAPANAPPEPPKAVAPPVVIIDRETRPATSTTRGASFFVGVSGLVGPGLYGPEHPFRVGAAVSAQLALSSDFFFQIGASAASTPSTEFPGRTPRWADVTLSAGVPLLGAPEHTGLEARVGVLAEYFDVAGGSFGDAARRRLSVGGEAALGARLELAPGLLFTAELEGALLSQRTTVMVGTNSAGTNGQARMLASFGLRVRLR